MKITGDEIIELMFLPMSDDKVVEAIDKLGWEQPTLDEEYEIEQEVCIEDDDNTGVTFVFKELDGYSTDGEPCLVEINFEPKREVDLPFELNYKDNLDSSSKKIGKEFNFNDKWSKFTKIWINNTKENIQYNFILHFTKEFKEIKSCVIIPFDKEDIGSILIDKE